MRTAATSRADINGRAACADHAVLRRPLYISLGVCSECGPTGGFGERHPHLTEVLTFH